MERKEQTGNICRWMALGVMAALIIVGCTIALGLFEWRDRKEIARQNAELYQWRRNVHDLNKGMAELAFLGETVAKWDSADVSGYHALRMEVDTMLQSITGVCPRQDVDSIRLLLAEKEMLLLQVKGAIQKRNDTHTELTKEVPKIVEKSKTERRKLSSTPRKKKRSFFKRLFGKKEKPAAVSKQPTQTEKMLANLNQSIVARHQQQSQEIVANLDSLGIRNETITHQLQKVMAEADEKVDAGIREHEQELETMEADYTYYYIGMSALLLSVLGWMFLLVRRNKKRTDRLIGELNDKNQQNIELLNMRRQTIQAITHELRIPLVTIKQGLGVSRTETADGHTVLLEAVGSMEQMLADLLDYFRLDNGKETIFAKPFAIKGLSTRLASEFAALADKKGIVLTVESASDEIVLGDKEKVLRIGRNLLSNALKFTDVGSVALHINYVDGMMLLSVHDTGTGMEEDEQRHIFEAFKQLGNAAAKDGFGLGLSIVKDLVDMMGGKIELASKKNVGSTFSVEIPLPLVHEKDIEEENEPGGYRAEVVVIDDNELMLQRIQGMFAENNIKCDICMNMDELLAKMREKEYDLLFTDLKMQGKNGYDVLKILRMTHIGNSQTIPIVVLTGAAGITKEELTVKGFSGCIFKPFSMKEIMDITERFIQQDTHRPTRIVLSPLYEYGEKQRTLWLFEEETEENRRRIDTAWEKGDRKELREVLHSMRGTWELIGCSEALNRVFSTVKNSAASDKDIAQGVNEIKRLCDDIIKAVKEEQKGEDA